MWFFSWAIVFGKIQVAWELKDKQEFVSQGHWEGWKRIHCNKCHLRGLVGVWRSLQFGDQVATYLRIHCLPVVTLSCESLFSITATNLPLLFGQVICLDLEMENPPRQRSPAVSSKLKEIDGSEIVKVNASRYPSLRNLWDKEYLEGKGRGYFICAFTLSNSFCKTHWIPLFGILDENSQKYGSKVFDSLVSLN